ncbi:hypothetical protein CBR_g39381 [Chara braunii]|uniref:CCHC-type domain-containing protein n=1 Tax=Chara braunii TaxID=69332 RepID=A0A388LRG3_CHABU|nr:hypothetical protein CBR_g39381 [Chara braunii]|eukprot:GBG84920.1 hypothetical protein CBR_g39381 [Chara braunii]
MVGNPNRDGCFQCGSMHHWVRECPHRGPGFRPPATGANVVPTGPPILALPAPSPSATGLASNNAASSSSYGPSSSNFRTGNTVEAGNRYQARPNWWVRNQERLDKVYVKYVEDTEREAKKEEEEAREKAKREEEEKLEAWKMEREKFEAAMGERLEKRLEALGIGKGKSVEAVSGDSTMEDVAKLRKENEDLKRKLSEALCLVGDDRVMYLQNEIMELRRKVGEKQFNEDVIAALKTEICELKQSSFMKTNFEQEIAGLRKEVNLLRDQNERAVLKIEQWKEEALHPCNKRDSVVLQTLNVSNRGSPKPRWTDNVREEDKWKAEYRNLQSLHRLANIEAEALKEKWAKAEARRMEAEKQVKVLEEKMGQLMASGEKGNGKTVVSRGYESQRSP